MKTLTEHTVSPVEMDPLYMTSNQVNQVNETNNFNKDLDNVIMATNENFRKFKPIKIRN